MPWSLYLIGNYPLPLPPVPIKWYMSTSSLSQHKQLGRGADHTPHSSTKVGYRWSNTSAFPLHLLGMLQNDPYLIWTFWGRETSLAAVRNQFLKHLICNLVTIPAELFRFTDMFHDIITSCLPVQITCHAQLQGDAQFVKTPEGLKKIASFHLHFYGVKVESPTQTIKVEQSQSDRSKKPFHPVL